MEPKEQITKDPIEKPAGKKAPLRELLKNPRAAIVVSEILKPLF